jgi:hypothetical protein
MGLEVRGVADVDVLVEAEVYDDVHGWAMECEEQV